MTSRVARKPVEIPSGVKITLNSENMLTVSGAKGELTHHVHRLVTLDIDDKCVKIVFPKMLTREINALSGTTRALIQNMVVGVEKGFEKKLLLKGVGYRAQLKGNMLNLSLGLSHPVNYAIPAGVTIEVPSQTEIVVRSLDKQLLGQVAADIRAYRPPEPYKGKGIRYADEHIQIKETKK